MCKRAKEPFHAKKGNDDCNLTTTVGYQPPIVEWHRFCNQNDPERNETLHCLLANDLGMSGLKVNLTNQGEYDFDERFNDWFASLGKDIGSCKGLQKLKVSDDLD